MVVALKMRWRDTKSHTTSAFTNQLDLLVKPTPTRCTFLVSNRQSNTHIIFESQQETQLKLME